MKRASLHNLENIDARFPLGLDVIKTADWVIDLGPEGGEKGGYLVAEGTPEAVAVVESSYTGRFLQEILGKERQCPA